METIYRFEQSKHIGGALHNGNTHSSIPVARAL